MHKKIRNKFGQFIKGHPNLKLTNKGNFKKGQIAWNKGTKGLIKPNCGSFKKGHIPKDPFKKGHSKPKNAYSFPKGKNHPNWTGGRHYHDKDGYIQIYTLNHPFKKKGNRIFEHRLIMEQMLGRYLTKNEIVHHKNGIRYDNRPENLILTVRNKNWHPCLCPKCGFEFAIE